MQRMEEQGIPRLINATNFSDPSSPIYGKPNSANGVYDFSFDFATIAYSMALYNEPLSKWYRSETLLDLMTSCCCYALNHDIREDGTTDNIISNFRQAEFFAAPQLCFLYRAFLKVENKTDKENKLEDLLYQVIKKISQGLLNSGFHTPNHRWVHTAALFTTYNTLKDEDKNPESIILANKYLDEKIDIDDNGDFAERSAGMYSAITDRALCYIAREGNLPELYQHVKKNLTLIFKYLESGTTIFTQNSTRRDKGEVGSDTVFDFGAYLDICVFAYKQTKDEFFIQVLLHAINRRKELYTPAFNSTAFFECRDIMLADYNIKERDDLPENFHIFQPTASIVRRRYNNVSYTLLANKTGFINITAGSITTTLRMCSSYFAIGQFVPEVIEQIGETSYRLVYKAHTGYKKPFDNPPEHSEQYWTMDYKSREDIAESDYSYEVLVSFVENEIKLHVKVDGMDRVPFKMEFVTTPNVMVNANGAMLEGSPNTSVSAKEGKITMQNMDGDYIEIDGVFCKHFYNRAMRGSVPVPANKFTVYLTDFSPLEKDITIKCEVNHKWDYFD